MRLIIIIFPVLVLTCGCSNNSKSNVSDSKPTNDTLRQEKVSLDVDSLQSFDTTTIQGKARQITQQLKDSGVYAAYGGADTLIDMNGDNLLDILFEFYGGAGTGLKNGAEIFLFDKSKDQFIKTDPINLPNPTFDFKNNTVVSYYIAMGGGYATKLKWNGLQLDTLEYIDVEITPIDKNKITVTSILHDYKTGKTTKSISDNINLPSEYKYFDYKPMVRKE